jgi:hypothetical protein
LLQDRRFNRVAVQQLCVGAIPWLGWVGPDKAAEVGQLAKWLRWLAVDMRDQPGLMVHARLERNAPDPFEGDPEPPSEEWDIEEDIEELFVHDPFDDMNAEEEQEVEVDEEEWW